MSHISVSTSFQKEIPLRIFILRLILSVYVTFEAIWGCKVDLKFYQEHYRHIRKKLFKTNVAILQI